MTLNVFHRSKDDVIDEPQRAFYPQAVSWSVKEVGVWVRELGLPAWVDRFREHRIQGDTMFSLNEQNLLEMGVTAIGDRLYIVDCLQSLYEELTAWKKKQEAVRSQAHPTRMLGGTTTGASSAHQDVGGSSNKLVQTLLSQGYTMAEIVSVMKSRPDLAAYLGVGRTGGR